MTKFMTSPNKKKVAPSKKQQQVSSSALAMVKKYVKWNEKWKEMILKCVTIKTKA